MPAKDTCLEEMYISWACISWASLWRACISKTCIIGVHLTGLHLIGRYISQDMHFRCVLSHGRSSLGGHVSYKRAYRRRTSHRQYPISAYLKDVSRLSNSCQQRRSPGLGKKFSTGGVMGLVRGAD